MVTPTFVVYALCTQLGNFGLIRDQRNRTDSDARIPMPDLVRWIPVKMPMPDWLRWILMKMPMPNYPVPAFRHLLIMLYIFPPPAVRTWECFLSQNPPAGCECEGVYFHKSTVCTWVCIVSVVARVVSLSTNSRVWAWGCIPFHNQQCRR